jgi:RimJ/RimL family protein N-acetyltransferase
LALDDHGFCQFGSIELRCQERAGPSLVPQFPDGRRHITARGIAVFEDRFRGELRGKGCLIRLHFRGGHALLHQLESPCGQRFGAEIANTMWHRAAEHPDVAWLRATVSPDNDASLAIIRAAGLLHVGEQMDPEDGLELIFEISAAEYLDQH